MARTALRIRVDGCGRLEVIDPGFDCVDLLRTIAPGFRVRRADLPGCAVPRFVALRHAASGLDADGLWSASEERLREAHRGWQKRFRAGSDVPRRGPGDASLVDLKIELAHRMLTRCRLCAHRCGADRTRGEAGVCGLGTASTVAEHFVHIAEEAPVNPSLVLNLAGCGLRCRYCQQAALLQPNAAGGVPLTGELWRELTPHGARTISFAGGNPDESLYAAVRFLDAAPPDWKLPVVWNCHAYATGEALDLLEGIADVYLPDFKYGNDACGRALSGAPRYPEAATAAVSHMVAQGVPVIVRILVLPGHVACCHVPALKILADLASPSVLVSVRGQYCPDGRITSADAPLDRRPVPEEIAAVRREARRRGLSLVD